jgi:hypothetical protein
VLPHVLEHVSIADRRADQRQAEPGEIALETEIGHHGADDAGRCQPAVGHPAFGDHRQNLVAVDNASALVDDQHPVSVAVERDADIGAHLLDLLAERGGLGRTAFVIDVEAVGLDSDGEHLGIQFLERLRRDPIAGAVGTVDNDAQALERKILRQRSFRELDIAVLDTVDASGAAEIGALGKLLGQVGVDQLLDLAFHIIAELEPVRTEQLDAIVVIRIMRGRYHHAKIGAHRPRQHPDRRRRDRTGLQHVHAD